MNLKCLICIGTMEDLIPEQEEPHDALTVYSGVAVCAFHLDDVMTQQQEAMQQQTGEGIEVVQFKRP